MLISLTVGLSFLSFICFGIWVMPNGIDSYPLARSLSYIAGPIHILLSPFIYALALVQLGFMWNWFAITAYIIIALNVVFYFFLFRKFESKILDIVFDLHDKAHFVSIVNSNAVLIIVLGQMVAHFG